MKIAILSFRRVGVKAASEELFLKKAAIVLGHKAKIFRVDHCQLFYDGRKPTVLYKEKPFPRYDLIIPRPSILNNVDLHVAIIKQFQLMKLPVVNGYMPVMRAKNKLRTLQMLNNEGIKVPKTIVIHDRNFLEDAVKKVGGTPVILKAPYGSFGHGVVIVESKRSLNSAWDLVKSNASAGMVLIQEYIRGSKGRDIRVFVVGGKVIASMLRQARRGEFRSNIELGGLSKGIEIDADLKKMAIKSTQAIGLQVAGVDIIQSKNEFSVMEVNSNPGFKELSKASGIDIAAEIIRYSVNYAKRYKAKFGK